MHQSASVFYEKGMLILTPCNFFDVTVISSVRVSKNEVNFIPVHYSVIVTVINNSIIGGVRLYLSMPLVFCTCDLYCY